MTTEMWRQAFPDGVDSLEFVQYVGIPEKTFALLLEKETNPERATDAFHFYYSVSPPTLEGYSALIHLCGRCGDSDKVLELFEELLTQHDLRPTRVLFLSVVKILSKLKEFSVLQSITEKMVETGKAEESLILALLARLNVSKALQILSVLENPTLLQILVTIRKMKSGECTEDQFQMLLECVDKFKADNNKLPRSATEDLRAMAGSFESGEQFLQKLKLKANVTYYNACLKRLIHTQGDKPESIKQITQPIFDKITQA
eukprot:CAMPEP_0206190970 /NCGR_PEP_ID=MMETSP0166-20121206/5069_1 /ASSEMBLY_ACC=CAM_ASM_000260 /TAXON_ID=95228 /ORGANISM="Vannella robusta, Strain DIVA3 518/3/11/1/6" /LENGTH=258 /DNA_ID=CAMNT_0053607155 /DNA_START=123 /DNA_END=895 /DNA_ORIENTATION=+